MDWRVLAVILQDGLDQLLNSARRIYPRAYNGLDSSVWRNAIRGDAVRIFQRKLQTFAHMGKQGLKRLTLRRKMEIVGMRHKIGLSIVALILTGVIFDDDLNFVFDGWGIHVHVPLLQKFTYPYADYSEFSILKLAVDDQAGKHQISLSEIPVQWGR